MVSTSPVRGRSAAGEWPLGTGYSQPQGDRESRVAGALRLILAGRELARRQAILCLLHKCLRDLGEEFGALLDKCSEIV